jgi:hypothetical protein
LKAGVIAFLRIPSLKAGAIAFLRIPSLKAGVIVVLRYFLLKLSGFYLLSSLLSLISSLLFAAHHKAKILFFQGQSSEKPLFTAFQSKTHYFSKTITILSTVLCIA